MSTSRRGHFIGSTHAPRPNSLLLPIALIVAITACDAGAPLPSDVELAPASARLLSESLADQVRLQAAARNLVSMHRPDPVRPELVTLGQALVFDKELSGNRDISCMTCHLPRFGTGDGLHLAIGQGGEGLGPDRVHPDNAFIPRNAPPLFNLHTLDALFWDGRVSIDADGGVSSPAGAQLTRKMQDVFEFGAISALGLFPVTSREEMRGFGRENELARIDDGDFTDIWTALMKRLQKLSEYVALFEAAYPGTKFEQMTFAHASNAMAGFFLDQLVFDNAPWDRFLAGDDEALTEAQLAGANVFTQIPCSTCHNGPALTDGLFHNVALASLGPGMGRGPDAGDDFGRSAVTGDETERYAFRTTPLRNVELTGPYGHAGQYVSLRDFIDHYSESDRKLRSFVEDQGDNIEPRLRAAILTNNFDAILATRSPIIDGVSFGDEVVGPVTTFMSALTDPRALDLSYLVPDRVPSGLPIDF